MPAILPFYRDLYGDPVPLAMLLLDPVQDSVAAWIWTEAWRRTSDRINNRLYHRAWRTVWEYSWQEIGALR